ncbi:MAG: hypothetical protein WDZ26_05515 [Nitriliruptoraceae bacterium]
MKNRTADPRSEALTIEELTVVDRRLVEELEAATVSPAVSVYVAHEHGEAVDVQVTRLRSALSTARDLLVESGLSARDAEALLEPGHVLQDQMRVSKGRHASLALFVSASGARALRLPYEVEDDVVVGNEFHVLPLFASAMAHPRFVIAAVSLHATRVFEASAWATSPVEIPDLPAGIDDEEAHDREHLLQRRQARSGPGDASFVHGHGGAKDVEGDLRAQHLRAVAQALHARFGDDDVPVVIAGVREVVHDLQARSPFANVVGVLPGSPDRRSAGDLRRDALAVMDAAERERVGTAVARLRDNGSAGRVAGLADDIAEAARDGRVDVLLLPEPGAYANLHGAEVERVNRAALDTLLGGGGVHVVPADLAEGLTLPVAHLRW